MKRPFAVKAIAPSPPKAGRNGFKILPVAVNPAAERLQQSPTANPDPLPGALRSLIADGDRLVLIDRCSRCGARHTVDRPGRQMLRCGHEAIVDYPRVDCVKLPAYA